MQRSGSSPTLWLVTSSVLFDAYETQAHGSQYLSPDRAQSASIYMVSFVDDSCCQVLAPHDGPFDEKHLIALIRHDAQLWSDLLYVSGGKLALHKCSYHFTWYDFEPSGKPPIRLGKFGGDVCLTTPDGDENLITHLSADVSYKTLGTRQNPASDSTEALAAITAKSTNYAILTATAPINRRDAWTFYTSIYVPSVFYPLPTHTFTKAQCESIQSGATKKIIQKMGLPGNLSPKICFGPSDLGGLSMKHAYTESGIGKLMLFIRHWRSDSQAGRLSRVLLAWVQALAGTSFSVLRFPARPMPHLEEAIKISYIRWYLSRAAGYLILDQEYVTPLQRVGDFHLMDAVLASGRFSAAKTCLIQYCRLFLQVHTVSDLTDSTGTTLKDGVRSGTLFSSSSTRLIPTIQARPNSRAWRTWRSALSLWANESDLLTLPLGDWTTLPTDQRFRWTRYVEIQYLAPLSSAIALL
jgi:hypothetical protein